MLLVTPDLDVVEASGFDTLGHAGDALLVAQRLFVPDALGEGDLDRGGGIAPSLEPLHVVAEALDLAPGRRPSRLPDISPPLVMSPTSTVQCALDAIEEVGAVLGVVFEVGRGSCRGSRL